MTIKRTWVSNLVVALALLVLASISLVSASVYATFTNTPLNSEWWLMWAIGQVAPIGTFLVVLFYKDDKNTANEEYQDKEKDIRDIVKAAGKSLNDFILRFNRETKKTAYIEKVNKKIMRRTYYNEWLNNSKLYRFKWLRKHIDKSVARREEVIETYKLRLNKEYIEENIDYVWFVRYDKITRSMIGTGVNLNRDRKMVESVGGYYGRSTAKKILLASATQALIASVVIQQIIIGITGQFWFNLVTSLFNILIQGYLANKTANTGFERYKLHNQTNRISILKEYKEWKDNEVLE